MARILLLEGDSPVRTLTRRILVMEGYDVVDVSLTNDALRVMEEATFDLAVIDVDVANDQGYELLDILHARTETASMPVIVTSSADDPDGVIREARAGVVDRLRKPYGFGQLASAVRRVLERDPAELADLRVIRSNAADLYRETFELARTIKKR